MSYPSLRPSVRVTSHLFRHSVLAGVAASLMFLGAGCSVPRLSSLGGSSTGTTPYATAPEEAAGKMLLAPGDSFEINQTFIGIGGILTQVSKVMDGTRTLKVTRFAPGEQAEASYETVVERETDKSRAARAEAEAQRLRGGASSTEVVIPEPIIERVVTTGTLTSIDLKSSHETYLPAYWKAGENRLLAEKTAIWLSADAFQELVRTKKTVLDFGFTESGTATLVKNVSEFRDALTKLRRDATTQEKTKDPMLLEVDSDQERISLVVNGKETSVSVIRAHNWFGEVVVLNNPQNPLILRMSFNPLTAAAAEIMGKERGLKTLFGYEIKNLNLAAF